MEAERAAETMDDLVPVEELRKEDGLRVTVVRVLGRLMVLRVGLVRR